MTDVKRLFMGNSYTYAHSIQPTVRPQRQAGTDRAPVVQCFLEILEIHLYDSDLTHPAYADSCLSAMTYYRTLFGASPADLSCLDLPENIKQVFSRALACVFQK